MVVNAVFVTADGASHFVSRHAASSAAASLALPGSPVRSFSSCTSRTLWWTTSNVLNDVPPALTFLPSGYAGLVDTIIVRSLGSTIVANGQRLRILDDLLFIDGSNVE
jgi:hypothetical protein